MRALLVEEQGSRLTVRGEELVVEREGASLARVRSGEVSRVLLFGGIELTAAARSLLLRSGIDTVFLTQAGRYRGRLVGEAHGSAAVRIGQYKALLDDSQRLAAAREIARGKIVNQRRLVQRVQARRPREDRAGPIVRLEALERALGPAISVDEVRGLEGAAAAEYFGIFGTLITNPTFRFTDRNRRPPRDPVNAMLSFGYALLQTVVEASVYRAGLDPFFGALHAPRHGATALVFDLMEEFRPLAVDSLVLELVNKRVIAAEDFAALPTGPEAEELLADEGGTSADFPEAAARPKGVHLAAEGRRILLRAFFRRLRHRALYGPRPERLSLEQIVAAQSYAFARWVDGTTPAYLTYTPR